ncbi:hypothetical protein LX36DRAFT_224579 [Colletotrichum falcatum]|nr:hypothetical protein LX36DRAFT_224579 [Colletotrichum falcatum]
MPCHETVLQYEQSCRVFLVWPNFVVFDTSSSMAPSPSTCPGFMTLVRPAFDRPCVRGGPPPPSFSYSRVAHSECAFNRFVSRYCFRPRVLLTLWSRFVVNWRVRLGQRSGSERLLWPTTHGAPSNRRSRMPMEPRRRLENHPGPPFRAKRGRREVVAVPASIKTAAIATWGGLVSETHNSQLFSLIQCNGFL